MPNHVTNIITAPQHVLDALKGTTEKGEDVLVDFDSLIPMPKTLHVDAEGRATSLAALLTGKIPLSPPKDEDGKIENMLAGLKLGNALQDLERGGIMQYKDQKSFDNFIQILRNCWEHGFPTWYEWSVENWGTKWNAYSFGNDIDGAVLFQTAWSAPHPVIRKLAEMFPDEKIIHRWADEDIGSNCGTHVYENGEVEEIEPADPVDFALMVTGNEREYYRENPETGKWEYYDADEEEDEVAV